MPGMGGIELLEKIKQKSPHTEAIIITGHGDIEIANDAMRKGAFSYIQKPIEYEKLLIEIKRALEKYKLNIK